MQQEMQRRIECKYDTPNVSYVTCILDEHSSSDVLPARARPWLGCTSFHRDGRTSSRPVRARPANIEYLPRLLVQAERRRHGQTVEKTLVRLRPDAALPALLHRQDGEARWRRLHLVPDDPGRVRRPRATVTQPASRVHVLRQDCRTVAVSCRTDARDDAYMDRRNLHWRRGLSAVSWTIVIVVVRLLTVHCKG